MMEIVFVLITTLIYTGAQSNTNESYVPFAIHASRKSPSFELSSGIFNSVYEENCKLLTLEQVDGHWVTSSNFILEGSTIHAANKNRSECSWRSSYLLAIAKQCPNGEVEIDKSLRVQVNLHESNEHLPVFNQLEYVAKYVEGTEPSDILKISAHDDDCINNHVACGYKIKEDVPFMVNSDGFVRPTRHIYKTHGKEQFMFHVVAFDCFDQAESQPALVTVKIEESCLPSISVNQISNTLSTQFPFKNLDIKTCPHCQLEDIVINFELQFSKNSRNICEKPQCESEGYKVALLNSYDTSLGENRPPSEKSEYAFNGHDDFLNIKDLSSVNHISSVSFWLKSYDPAFSQHKQQILCKSDKDSMNRHHFSVYLHDNMLKMLLRHDPQPEPANHEFYPSLWQWDISRIDPKFWTFYRISIDHEWQKVTLHVNDSEQEIHLANVVKSLPLEAIVSGESDSGTTVSAIGACWHGRSQRWSQNFQGKLAKLEIVKRKLRDSSCTRKCAERFQDAHDIGEMKKWEIAFNENNSVAIVRAQTANQIRSVLSKLEYVPDPLGNVTDTFVNITGAIVCKDMPKQVLPSVYIILKSKQVNQILSELRITRSSRFQHFQPFANISILPPILREMQSFTNCTITVDPVPADVDEVYLLNIPGFKVSQEKDRSFVFEGENIKDIQNFLNNIVYVSASQGATSKQFDLNCWASNRGQLFHSLLIENSQHGKIVRRSLSVDNVFGGQGDAKINDKADIPIKGFLVVGALMATCSFLIAYILINVPNKSRNKRHSRIPSNEVEMQTLTPRYVPSAQDNEFRA
ncbi:hypothetical protein ACOME3_002678 [Neoechinorhynchus agilis]